MIDKLQKLFLERIILKYRENDILLIFKGFSFKFLESIDNKISPLNNLSTFTTNYKLDLDKLSKKSVKRSIQRSFLDDLNSLNFCSYEELLIADQKIDDLDVKVILVENDFFKNEIINPTNNIYPDIDKEISSELGVMNFEDENFNMIFANSYVNENKVNYLNYRTLINTDIKVRFIYFYDKILSSKLDIFDFSMNHVRNLNSANIVNTIGLSNTSIG